MRLIPPTTAKLVDHYRRVRDDPSRARLALVTDLPGRAPDPEPRLPGWNPRELLRLPAHAAPAYAALRHHASLDPDTVALLAQRLLADAVIDADLVGARQSTATPTIEWLTDGARSGRALGLDALTVTACRLADGRRCVLVDLDAVGPRELEALATLHAAGVAVVIDGMSAASPGLNVRVKLVGGSGSRQSANR